MKRKLYEKENAISLLEARNKLNFSETTSNRKLSKNEIVSILALLLMYYFS